METQHTHQQLIKRLKNEIKQKDRLLHEKNAEVANYLYTITHELRTPVVSMRGYSNLLQDFHQDELKGEIKTYLDRIIVNINNMENLIDDLLEFARINVNKNECDYFNVNEIIDKALDEIKYLAHEKEVTIQKSEQFPLVFCHRNLMTCVYANLLSNALKFSKKDNKVQIQLGYYDNEIFYKFFIRDNGIGIKKNKSFQLFKPFSRLHDSAEIKGNGLGLAITRRIIEGHGGEIWAESVYRKGTTFYFTLPR